MKIVLPVLVVMITAFTARSQKISYGITAGVNTGFIKMEGGGEIWEGNITGLQAGASATFHLRKSFAVQSGLLFVSKGGSTFGNETRINAVELPVSFLYTHKGFFAGGGIGIGYGLSNKMKYNENNEVKQMDLYDENNPYIHLKRLELSGNIVIGYNFLRGFTVQAGFVPGFTNLRQEDEQYEYTLRTKRFEFSVGYQLGR